MVITAIIACCLAAYQSEELYFRWRYGPRVPAGDIGSSYINDTSYDFLVRGQLFSSDDSRVIVEVVFWKGGPKPDTSFRGMWETGEEHRPYIIRIGKELLYMHPANVRETPPGELAAQ